MKALVAYYSESENTRKLADAVAAGAGTSAVRLEEVDPLALERFDLICIGTPVQAGRPARRVQQFISRMPRLPGRRCAAFCTMHAYGAERTLKRMQESLEAKGLVYLGGCSARGWSRLVGNFGPRIFNRGRPDREELERATAFGRELKRLARPRDAQDLPKGGEVAAPGAHS